MGKLLSIPGVGSSLLPILLLYQFLFLMLHFLLILRESKERSEPSIFSPPWGVWASAAKWPCLPQCYNLWEASPLSPACPFRAASAVACQNVIKHTRNGMWFPRWQVGCQQRMGTYRDKERGFLTPDGVVRGSWNRCLEESFIGENARHQDYISGFQQDLSSHELRNEFEKLRA